MNEIAKYRAWVLRHWREGGWRGARHSVHTTKKGQAALARLVKDGLLEQMDGAPDYYRITEKALSIRDEKDGRPPAAPGRAGGATDGGGE